MAGFGCSARRCERPTIRLSRVVLTLLPVMLLMPSAAVACPSWSGVAAMNGTATTNFQGTASGSDNEGGTLVIALSRAGKVNVLLPKRIPPTGDASTEFIGATSGGSLHVNDTSTDTFTSTAGSQSGDGPVVTSTTLGDLASLVLDRASCTYQLHIGFSVRTSSAGELPFGQDLGAGGFAITPVRPIPASLALVGSATVPVYYECVDFSPSPSGGCYGEDEGLNTASNWGGEYHLLKSCGSVVASNCNFGGQEGTASFSWNLSPTISSAQGCSVSGGGGVTSALRLGAGPEAGIAEGPIQHCSCSEDASGTYKCVCTPLSTCDQDKAAAKQRKKEWSKNLTLVFTGAAGVFAFAGAAYAFVPGAQVAALEMVALAGGASFAAVKSSYMAEDDPPDRNWRSIATAQPTGPTKVKAGGVVSANQAASASAVLSQIARVNGLDQAFLVSNNRRASASKARATLWVKRQTQAMGRYAIKAADAIGKLVTLIQQAQATLSAPLPPLTTQDLKQAALGVAAHGLPTSLTSLWSKYRLPASLLAKVKKRVQSRTPPTRYASSVYGVLGQPTLLADLQSEGDALRLYGQLLLAVG